MRLIINIPQRSVELQSFMMPSSAGRAFHALGYRAESKMNA